MRQVSQVNCGQVRKERLEIVLSCTGTFVAQWFETIKDKDKVLSCYNIRTDRCQQLRINFLLMQSLTLFLLGVRDSISPTWIKKILLYTHPETKEIHPQSKVLIGSIYRTIIQVVAIYILLPVFLTWAGTYFSIFNILYYYGWVLVTILTYGYTFFYFSDTFDATVHIAKWTQRISTELGKEPSYGGLEIREKMTVLDSLSNKIKSFIFLACYFVVFAMSSLVLIHIPYFGRLNLIISESYFNGIFFFLRKWPYDEYNVGFMEKSWAYLTGFGLAISVICNYLFASNNLLSTGFYFLLSVWMIVNMTVSSPPDLEVKSFADMCKVLTTKRKDLNNSYNAHRDKLKESLEYRTQIKREIRLLRPILYATNKINVLLGRIQPQQ